MNKMNGWVAGCLGLGMMLMACGGDSATGPGGGGALTEAALVGKWNITSVNNKGWQNDDNGVKQNIDSTDTYPAGLSTVEYKSDKTVSIDMGGFAINGTWSIKGDSVITISSILGFSDTSSAYAVINGNSGTFTTHQVDIDEDLIVTTKAAK